ncbi:sigma 54-interacting transcriptional regulator [Burkholderia sp. S171]|uniref:sigma 54-interacting transcriptional regulator n=1 Tax=Burkholderia sp. S171 TaxID=1641860 RepID=UPI0020B12D0B|nr:sigma 54-interacting transcriptional regulator [Burkholderia sp. S171]
MYTKPGEVEGETSSNWRESEMLLLQQVMALVGKNLSPVPVLREMLHLMSELLGLNRGRVVLRDEGAKTSRIKHAYGLTPQEVECGCYDEGEGITGQVLRNGHLIIVQDIDAEPGFLGRAVERSKLPPGPVSFIALPIMGGQFAIGVLACHRIRTRTRALADDVTLLRILATLIGQLLQLEANLMEKTHALEQRNAILAQALASGSARYGIIGTSPRLLRAISELERVSDSSASVLLLGESGTGKELFARALHLASPRRDKAFIKINCAAIPETLFESELFGYERGAFTGAATARAGWFERADAGTIFLDEIGEMPLTLQTKLLRTLQEGTLTRLGGIQEIRVDVRLVAATHRDLLSGVADGTFRQDLYYRLNVIPINLPSLAERREDIRELALHFISHANQVNQRNVNLTAAALARLQDYSWPGNIRELANLIERIVLLAEQPLQEAADIERYLPRESDAMEKEQFAASSMPAAPHLPLRPYGSVDSHSADVLHNALKQCGGNKSRAAQLLGMTARQFNYRWKKLAS